MLINLTVSTATGEASRHRISSTGTRDFSCKFKSNKRGRKKMNKPATIDFATATAVQIPAAIAHTQALHDLVPGEARDSLPAVHDVLRRELPQGQLATYEAGGGSCSVLPPELLSGSKVPVFDIEGDKVKKKKNADKGILGDVQTYLFERLQFDLVIC